MPTFVKLFAFTLYAFHIRLNLPRRVKAIHQLIKDGPIAFSAEVFALLQQFKTEGGAIFDDFSTFRTINFFRGASHG